MKLGSQILGFALMIAELDLPAGHRIQVNSARQQHGSDVQRVEAHQAGLAMRVISSANRLE
jgi:hypothetical protein